MRRGLKNERGYAEKAPGAAAVIGLLFVIEDLFLLVPLLEGVQKLCPRVAQQ